MKFADIELYPRASWEIDVELGQLLRHHEMWTRDYGLNLDPDYQRGHVWTVQQQTAYVEHLLRGGEVSRSIIVNAPGFASGESVSAEMVDGKQRYTALLSFVNNKLSVFNAFFRDFTDRPRCFISIQWRVMELDRKEVLKLYVALNRGGTPHSEQEIARVQDLLHET